jgi:hypothetical protein
MELASCHPSNAYDLEVAPRFLENLWILTQIMIGTGTNVSYLTSYEFAEELTSR